ncbi:Ca-activated chloride channel family protein [Paenibacillus sp. UNCCL117]|uniref:vWA domain-containing protein n=1 Tax=unclassified Paenibacillus TaxID=185978 RepID=UPI00088A32EA|nr:MULTISPECIES: VWA domain-containing protein [unclassified Paenibacillus]SDE54146.1 Ca-activated chloride channel family protein [Paenibacillus sp. cl123]SFW68146.1 Ca-activated chloride channel family protein [Paenibacillus sp. UNCCL117]
MKQIILITDGCSNVGMSPVIAAAHAQSEGIVVHVIGITDDGELGVLGAEEIQEIAAAGGGISRIVKPAQLSQTVQMLTRKTVAQTVRQAVGQELRSILGHDRIEALPPQERSEVVRVIDDWAEKAELRVALLIDASASMKPKLQAVKESIHDLQLSLQARTGESLLSVFHFPGNISGDLEVEMDFGWTDNLANLNRLFYKLNMKGTTPTGPALMKVVQFVAGDADDTREASKLPAASAQAGRGRTREEGIWSDYIV